QLLLQYTEKHPQVQALNDSIARLEEEKRSGAKISSSVAAPGASVSSSEAIIRSLDMNPVYQNLRLALSQADADLAAIRGQIQAQQAVVNELRSRIEAMPEVEAELARLNRDYDINKKQYDSLLMRLESAKISEEADETAQNIKFRVIEPPAIPLRPSGPPRLILNALVLLLSLVAGTAAAVGLALLHPTVATRGALEKLTGKRVLGATSLALRPLQLAVERRQRLLWSGAVSALFVAFLLNIWLTEPLRVLLRPSGG
ncbi:MAG: hypothetical protein NZM12_11190, partial [Steroidobacteraceae bacterium]|nr:hypothetical protein [Steroidobacteraceae bacterium]